MARRLVLAGGALALVVVLAAALTARAPRRSGTNMTPDPSFVSVLDSGQRVCQGKDMLPGDTAAMRMTIGTYNLPGPPLEVQISSSSGAPLTHGGLPAGWTQGAVTIPLAHASTPMADTTVCLRNLGPGRIALGGDSIDPGYEVVLDGKSSEGRLRIDYLRPGSESWLQLLPTIVHRFSLGKSDLVRHWAAGGVLVLMLLAIGLAGLAILKEET